MEEQAFTTTPPAEVPVPATGICTVTTSSIFADTVNTLPPSPDAKPVTITRARGSATSTMTTADIGKVLLSLTPARDNATDSHRTGSLAVLTRTNSDPALRSAESSPNKLAPQTEYSPKRRRSLGSASFGQCAALDEKCKDGFLHVFGL